jgi:hypothetical protein
VYYYTAFAFDDRTNWSVPEAGAQWKSDNVTALDPTYNIIPAPHKFLRNGQLVIQRGSETYTALGTISE